MSAAIVHEQTSAMKSLRSKFFSGGIVVLVTIFFTLMLLLPFISFELDEQSRQFQEDMRGNLREEAITIARLLVFEFSRLQDLIDILYLPRSELEEALQPIRKYLWEKVIFNEIIEDIQLLDESGLLHLRPYGAETNEKTAKVEPENADISKYQGISNRVYLPSEDAAYVFMPLYIEGNRWGVVKITVSTEVIQRQIDAQIARQGDFSQLVLLLFFGALVLSSAVGVFILSILARRITEPIKSLARNAELFAESGDVQRLEKIDIGNDEVGLLAQNFNKMAADINRLLQEKDEAFAQLKTSQEQLRQSEKLATLGQLSGGIAHEINNALSPIRLRSEEVLLTLDEGGAAEREDLQLILKGIDQCSTIVQKLRDFATPSLGGRASIDLNTIIRGTVVLVRRQIEKRRIRIELELGKIPLINANSGELEQVLMNMLLNSRDAIEATGRGSGTIKITTSVTDGSVQVTISDDGTGMDQDTQKRMFEPFFTTKAVGEGTGLGMSVSFGILQSHGAQLTIESELGNGSAITVRFPNPPLRPVRSDDDG